MNNGWIKLHRKLKKHWTWKEPLSLKLWIDFLMRANHEGAKIKIGSNFIKVERGSFITSQFGLAKEYSCSRKRINTFLGLLRKDKMIDFKGHSKYTIITISNYNTYQDSGATEEHQKNIKGTSTEHQENTNKKYKNVKNDKNINEGWKGEPSDEISLLWIKTFGKQPNLIEWEETKKLINEFGKEKVEKEFRDAIINGAKSLRYVINALKNTNGVKQNEANNSSPKTIFQQRIEYKPDPEKYQKNLEYYRKRFG
ncbi:MAG: hypothetical protein KDC90_01495 [Ignavibacteriae bacterium]|nr:hypothetical protein [Ignavibacteriota bacterium]